MDIGQEIFDFISKSNQIQAQSMDNIFNADHRNEMIRQYKYTEAMRVKIEDLI